MSQDYLPWLAEIYLFYLFHEHTWVSAKPVIFVTLRCEVYKFCSNCNSFRFQVEQNKTIGKSVKFKDGNSVILNNLLIFNAIRERRRKGSSFERWNKQNCLLTFFAPWPDSFSFSPIPLTGCVAAIVTVRICLHNRVHGCFQCLRNSSLCTESRGQDTYTHAYT